MGPKGVVGITHFAQDQLGDVVFVEVPAVGTELAAENTFGVVESVKTVSDLYAPVAGKVAPSTRIWKPTPNWSIRIPTAKAG